MRFQLLDDFCYHEHKKILCHHFLYWVWAFCTFSQTLLLADLKYFLTLRLKKIIIIFILFVFTKTMSRTIMNTRDQGEDENNINKYNIN